MKNRTEEGVYDYFYILWSFSKGENKKVKFNRHDKLTGKFFIYLFLMGLGFSKWQKKLVFAAVSTKKIR
jgi:hypothetical protein